MEQAKTPLERAIEAAGSQARVAQIVGKTQQAVSHWLTARKGLVPADAAIRIERALGIPAAELCPDAFAPLAPQQEPAQ